MWCGLHALAKGSPRRDFSLKRHLVTQGHGAAAAFKILIVSHASSLSVVGEIVFVKEVIDPET